MPSDLVVCPKWGCHPFACNNQQKKSDKGPCVSQIDISFFFYRLMAPCASNLTWSKRVQESQESCCKVATLGFHVIRVNLIYILLSLHPKYLQASNFKLQASNFKIGTSRNGITDILLLNLNK